MSKKKKHKKPSGAKESPAEEKRSQSCDSSFSVPTGLIGRAHWSNYLMLGLVALMAFGTLLFFTRAVYFVLYPYTINYSEDSLLVSALELAAGRNPYDIRRFSEPPYILTPYPPVYYALVAAFLKITGPSLTPGRIISIISSLGIVFIIFSTIKRESGNVLAGIIGGLTYLALYPANVWGPTHRVDNVTLLLAFAGLYFGTSANLSARRMAAAGVFLLISIFTKQSSVAAFMVVAACLAANNWKRAALFVGAFLAVWALVFALLYFVSGGGYYLNTVTSLSTNPVSWDRFYMLTVKEFNRTQNLIITAIIVVAFALRYIKPDRWALYSGLALTQGLLTVGKFGSGPNYFLEFGAALSILLGILIAVAHGKAREKREWGILAISLSILVAVFAAHFQNSFFIKQSFKLIEIARENVENTKSKKIINYYSKEGDYLLTKQIDLAIFSNRVPVVNDPFTFSFLARIGRWDESKTIAMMANGAIPLVILDQGPDGIDKSEFLSDAMKKELIIHYNFFATSSGAFFYRHNKFIGPPH